MIERLLGKGGSMNKQELIEKYEDKLKDDQLKFGASFKTKVYEELIEDLKQLDEQQKVVVSEKEAKFLETFDFNCESDVTTPAKSSKVTASVGCLIAQVSK